MPDDLRQAIASGVARHTAGDLLAARSILSRALVDERLAEPDRAWLRERLARIADDLVFSPQVSPGDPFAFVYTVQSGDSLVRIAQREHLATDWRLIRRINRMPDENRLTVGQRLKLLRGPFHAVVVKSAYRLDVWLGPGDRPSDWVFVRSFPVGLGEANSTPVGTFVVKKGGKLIDPPWINPRTGERFAGGDPANPIGRRWIGIEGVGTSSIHVGYGLHGTIEPDSIGQQRSMGCVRLLPDDIVLLFELLGEQVSIVRIEP